jgi:hypothetical protein
MRWDAPYHSWFMIQEQQQAAHTEQEGRVLELQEALECAQQQLVCLRAPLCRKEKGRREMKRVISKAKQSLPLFITVGGGPECIGGGRSAERLSGGEGH